MASRIHNEAGLAINLHPSSIVRRGFYGMALRPGNWRRSPPPHVIEHGCNRGRGLDATIPEIFGQCGVSGGADLRSGSSPVAARAPGGSEASGVPRGKDVREGVDASIGGELPSDYDSDGWDSAGRERKSLRALEEAFHPKQPDVEDGYRDKDIKGPASSPGARVREGSEIQQSALLQQNVSLALKHDNYVLSQPYPEPSDEDYPLAMKHKDAASLRTLSTAVKVDQNRLMAERAPDALERVIARIKELAPVAFAKNLHLLENTASAPTEEMSQPTESPAPLPE
jgi:hypothetical protein